MPGLCSHLTPALVRVQLSSRMVEKLPVGSNMDDLDLRPHNPAFGDRGDGEKASPSGWRGGGFDRSASMDEGSRTHELMQHHQSMNVDLQARAPPLVVQQQTPGLQNRSIGGPIFPCLFCCSSHCLASERFAPLVKLLQNSCHAQQQTKLTIVRCV
jgi:hypothetical protein